MSSIRSIRRKTVFCFFALLLLPAAARAADDAVELYKKGRKAYLAGSYADAVRFYEAANKLRYSAKMHYNIALCQEKLGKMAEAVQSYERYLKEVEDAPNAAVVKKRVAELRAKLHATETAPPTTDPVTTPTPSSQPGIPPPEPTLPYIPRFRRGGFTIGGFIGLGLTGYVSANDVSPTVAFYMSLPRVGYFFTPRVGLLLDAHLMIQRLAVDMPFGGSENKLEIDGVAAIVAHFYAMPNLWFGGGLGPAWGKPPVYFDVMDPRYEFDFRVGVGVVAGGGYDFYKFNDWTMGLEIKIVAHVYPQIENDALRIVQGIAGVGIHYN